MAHAARRHRDAAPAEPTPMPSERNRARSRTQPRRAAPYAPTRAVDAAVFHVHRARCGAARYRGACVLPAAEPSAIKIRLARRNQRQLRLQPKMPHATPAPSAATGAGPVRWLARMSLQIATSAHLPHSPVARGESAWSLPRRPHCRVLPASSMSAVAPQLHPGSAIAFTAYVVVKGRFRQREQNPPARHWFKPPAVRRRY